MWETAKEYMARERTTKQGQTMYSKGHAEKYTLKKKEQSVKGIGDMVKSYITHVIKSDEGRRERKG